MITESSIEIDAPASIVWRVFTAVEQWPEWTASVTTLEGLDGPALEVGRRFRIKQPRMPKLLWEVIALEPGRSWTWQQRSPGARTLASHDVVEGGKARTLVRQRIDQRGPIGVVVAVLSRRLTNRYLTMEAEGLKARSEAQHRSDAPTA